MWTTCAESEGGRSVTAPPNRLRYYMVAFPAVIESGSEATLCTSLLKPNETLLMTIYLLHNKQSRTLLQERVEEEFHHCSQFKAPQVEGESVQEIRVEVRDIVTAINGTKQDNKGNRIGQWTNVSSTGLIVQLSHELNPEAPEGHYKLEAHIGNRETRHYFKVKKYILPRFEVTVKTPEQQSVGEEELKIELCAKYTYGQPVPGKALVEVCRKFIQEVVPKISPCLEETVQMNETGCASAVFNMSAFTSPEFEHDLQSNLDAAVTVTEEGTDISIIKSKHIELSDVICKVEFFDLPKNFEHGLTNFKINTSDHP
ncbi:ovostatin homolog 2 [Colossoma macropomum]|uniref:ovostatin homolog 2 n=1 Tax=Colossoma macropomum TaxID=42526 RepID=UPI0018651D52|nr:ovostatin homolog 2 [Colossoma macropomum]